MKQEELKVAIQAIHTWIYHAWNYSMESYRWTDSEGMEHEDILPSFLIHTKWNTNLQHMIKKWKMASGGNEPTAYLPNFYAGPSTGNCVALLEWILENYEDAKIYS